MRNKIRDSCLFIMLMISLFPFVSGCSSTSNTTTHTATVKNSELGYTSLLDLLRRQPNLNIRGDGPYATITMRGLRSIEGNNEPLFVVDGTPLGNGYVSASSIDVTTVKSIQVLSPSQSALYGSRGSNGVIKIVLKK